jgi:hypothetical protein
MATLACDTKRGQAVCVFAPRKVTISTLQAFANDRDVSAQTRLCPRYFKMNEGPRIAMCEESESWLMAVESNASKGASRHGVQMS